MTGKLRNLWTKDSETNFQYRPRRYWVGVGTDMPSDSYLFNRIDWFSFERELKAAIFSKIYSIDGNRLLNTSVEDLCGYFEQEYKFDVPVLHEDQAESDTDDAKIDVSHDPRRHISDRSRPFYITGTRVEITVPFTGDRRAFDIRPTKFLSLGELSARIQNSLLIIGTEGVDMTQEQVKSRITGTLGDIRSYLEWLRNDAGKFNDGIRQLARMYIEQRRQKLLDDRNLTNELGFPLKRRPDVPKTFPAPDVRRKIRPSMPSAGKSPYNPEPVLSGDDYEHILSVMHNMALVMERSPSAFISADENTLRSHFLVQLNGHYEGQATGETFNFEGKTDILIRVDGRNIFIAECKFWSGAKKLGETIDQLLCYASWRDTKTAIVVFSRNKGFSEVLETIPAVVKNHPNFKREIKTEAEESWFRYIFGQKNDPNREMFLTILTFDLPRG